MSEIHVIVGPPCAGKSTHVTEHKNAGDVVVDFDLIARALGAEERRPEGALKEVAFAARTAIITKILDGIDADSWIIHTRPSREQVETYREAGATFTILDPGIDECLKRMEADDRPDGTEETIRDWYASPPDLAEHEEPAKSGFFYAPKGASEMKLKSLAIQVKAGTDDGLEDGQFIAYASTFIREPDAYGDIVAKGAFTKTLAKWASSGNVLPVLFGHRFDDPDYNLGGVIEAVEDDRGLKITGQLDLENPKSAQVYRLLKGRRIGEMSFAYDVLDGGFVELDDGTEVFELREVELYEVSIVPIGANRDTEILAVKTAADALNRGVKAGRVLAQKHIDSLRAAQEAIGAVITAAEADQEKANGNSDNQPDASDEEPVGVKSPVSGEGSKNEPPVKDLAALFNIYATAYAGQEGA